MRQVPPMSNMTSNIDIYRIFRKIPDVSDDEAKHAADLVARVDQVATKDDLIAQDARLEAKMLKLAIWAVSFTVTFTVTLTVSLIKLL